MTSTENNVWNEDTADLGLTIKYGKGYEEPWLTAKGNSESIKAGLAAFFGLDREEIEGLTAHEVVLNCKKLAIGTSAVVAGLGGTVINGTRPARGGWQAAAEGSAPAEPAEPERNPLFATIDAATTVDAVKDIYARNVDAIKADPELLAAWKAKGKELSGK